MREIPLTQGKITLVDDDDYEYLITFKWRALKEGNSWYAGRSVPSGIIKPRQKLIHMHCVIMGRLWIDHVDGNGLNNQRTNLRFCTRSQNCANSKRKNKTGYRGVYFDGIGYSARISINGIKKHLGYSLDKIEMALLFDTAARELYGKFARLNFPLD